MDSLHIARDVKKIGQGWPDSAYASFSFPVKFSSTSEHSLQTLDQTDEDMASHGGHMTESQGGSCRN